MKEVIFIPKIENGKKVRNFSIFCILEKLYALIPKELLLNC